MNKMTECKFCKCKPVCKHQEQWSKYCEEHILLRKESVLFDEEPMCGFYIEDKKLINIEKQRETGSRIESLAEKLTRDKREELSMNIEFDDISSITDNDVYRLINKMITEGIFK